MSRGRRIAGIVVVALTLARLVYGALLGLVPQEAYYWQYARHPALSYLDHPLMIAAWIGAGVHLVGTTPLGVRLVGIVSGGLVSFLVYLLGERLYGPRVGLAALVTANATVLFGIGAVIQTPDVPLTLFWAAALLVLAELVLPDGAGPGRFGARFYLLGLLVGLGLVSKYTAALLYPTILLALVLSPEGRRALRTAHPYLAAGLSLLVFSPVVVWNAEHGFASFAFQTTRRLADAGAASSDLLGRYVGLQAAAVTPLVYGALFWALWRGVRLARDGDARARLLVLASAPGLLVFTAVSPATWVKLNWVGPAYLGALVLAVALVAERWQRRRLRRFAIAAVSLGALMTLSTYALPFLPSVPVPPRADLVDGWPALATVIHDRVLADHDARTLVVGWDYKTASELAFYLPGHPETTSGNVLGWGGLAYHYWFTPSLHAGEDALVVSDRRHPMKDAEARLAPICHTVTRLGPVAVHRGTELVTLFDVYRCVDYRPPEPLGSAAAAEAEAFGAASVAPRASATYRRAPARGVAGSRSSART